MNKRNIIKITCFVIFVVLYFILCSYNVSLKHKKQNDEYNKLTKSMQQMPKFDYNYLAGLWDKTVTKTMNSPDKSIDNQAELLSVPLYSAFSMGNLNYINQFKTYFQKVYDSNAYEIANKQAKCNVIFLSSCFINLCEKNNIDYNHTIKEKTLKELLSIYNQSNSYNYISFKNMKESIQFKLSDQSVHYKHLKAVNNEELLIVAAAANLYPSNKNSVSLQEIVSFIEPLTSKETIVYLNDYWLYQPGIRYDNPNYAYSNADSLNKTNVKIDIAQDIMSFSRMPIILQSMKQAVDQDYKEYINKLLKDLSKHYLRDLIVYPGDTDRIFKTKNFMNGDNGYLKAANHEFFRPFELSTNIYFGAWAFLNTDEIKNFYTYVYSLFPLKENEFLSINTGITKSKTTQETTNSDQLLKDYMELNCYLAAYLDLLP